MHIDAFSVLCAQLTGDLLAIAKFLFLFVTLWNYKVCDNGNAMKQCNFQNNYGVSA